MALTDFILNIAGLLLWLNWLSLHFDPLAKTPALSLVGTLRRADTAGPKRWRSLAAVIGLVFIRAVIYQQVAPALNWTPRLSLPPIAPPFRNADFSSELLYSALSFLTTLATFYLSLLLLSLANRDVPDTDPLQKMVRVYFKWLERWPAPVKLLLPLLAGAVFWLALHPLLSNVGVVPRARSGTQLLEQAAIIGAGAYLYWQYIILGVLALHLFNSYVFVGDHPFWNFVNVSARNLLRPVRWMPLRVGRIDLLPVAAIVLVVAVVNFFSIGDFFAHPKGTFRPWVYRRLPF